MRLLLSVIYHACIGLGMAFGFFIVMGGALVLGEQVWILVPHWMQWPEMITCVSVAMLAIGVVSKFYHESYL